MTFWNKVKSDMRKGMKQGVSALKEGSNVAFEKAGQVAEVGKTRYQIFLLEQKTEKNFSEIGQRIYDLISENGSKNPLSDPLVKSKLAEAKKLEKKAKILHEKMGTIRKKIA
ncbi:MAG TPA: hypothetical protein VI382_02615 [Candidatus Manganitrophaceae bacterium]|nr:hypothetical protein [Candidatus Manganitrophaceae bacterium]